MRILLLNWRDMKNEWAGGAEMYVTELAENWAKMGHEVLFFTGQNYSKNLPSEEVINGVKIYRRGGRYSLYLWAVWYYITKFRNKCDVIVEAINGVPFFSRLFSRKPVFAILFHVHGLQFFIELPPPMSYIGYFMEKFFLPFFYSNTRLIAISETTKSDLVKLGLPKENIDVVYCGLNLKRNGAVLKFSNPTILYLGKIKKYKRVNLLVKFMPEILKKVPTARLLIAGWGTDGPYLTDLSMKSDVRKKVKIMGPVSEQEKKSLMSKSWVCVNPSIHEGWGIPVIEANLFGTPTVAFHVPGLSESIQNGDTGLLAENEEEFIEGVVKLLQDKQYRARMGRQAMKWADTFKWEKSSKEFISIIESHTNAKN
jgi:glycosyltransferase involved in cell wall biosynthesis